MWAYTMIFSSYNASNRYVLMIWSMLWLNNSIEGRKERKVINTQGLCEVPLLVLPFPLPFLQILSCYSGGPHPTC